MQLWKATPNHFKPFGEIKAGRYGIRTGNAGALPGFKRIVEDLDRLMDNE